MMALRVALPSSIGATGLSVAEFLATAKKAAAGNMALIQQLSIVTTRGSNRGRFDF
jgi:hypothetical protein